MEAAAGAGAAPAKRTVIRVARKRGQPVPEYLVVTAEPSLKRRVLEGLEGLTTSDAVAVGDDAAADGPALPAVDGVGPVVPPVAAGSDAAGGAAAKAAQGACRWC
jgi:hypothetical protein